MARIKLAYPKIPARNATAVDRCVAFEKCDGTNMHWVWERELGWYAFGTRRDRFDLDMQGIEEFQATHAELKEAAPVFLQTLAEPLVDVFRVNQFFDSETITVFTEFLGPNSFAGRHRATDPKKLVLFDIEVQAGLIAPEDFVDIFGGLDIPRVVYRGKFNGRFTADVRAGRFNVDEGVVCKGGETGNVWMIKVIFKKQKSA